jgi:inner membrane protein
MSDISNEKSAPSGPEDPLKRDPQKPDPQKREAQKPEIQALRLGLPKLPSRSLGLKFILVCCLALLMAIPALFVNDIAKERARNAASVVSELGAQMGGEQSVAGPILIVPMTRNVARTEQVPGPDGTMREVTRTLSERGWWAFFAETGEAKVVLSASELRRSIYKVPTYVADIDLKARFNVREVAANLPRDVTLDWTGARMLSWVTDLRGVKNSVVLSLPDGTTRTFEPASDAQLSALPGLSPAQVAERVRNQMVEPSLERQRTQPIWADLTGFDLQDAPIDVSVALKVSGVDRLSLPAFAQDTKVSARGNWPDPKFEGAFVADMRRVGSAVRDATGAQKPVQGSPAAETGTFEVQWRAPFLARGMPKAGAVGSEVDLAQLASKDFAIALIQRSEVYVGVQRALRYCLLFIGTVFLAYFLFEATGGGRAHPAQYLLVGLAQCVFYLLLLAFAEKWGFDLAFLIAAVPTVALSSWYAAGVFKSTAKGVQALVAFSGVYGLMYVLMTLEDQALLAGALTAFAAIAAVMWLTRRVNWYGDQGTRPEPA